MIRLNEPLPIQKKSAEVLTIQESIFGDVTRQIRLVSWENQNRQLAIDKCYKLDTIDDIGEVAGPTSDQQLISSDKYLQCMNCKGKVNHLTAIIGECSRCDSKFKISSCHKGSSTTHFSARQWQ